jgi:two-component sensor histidine kinase
MVNKPLISVKNIFIIAFIIVISFSIISFLLSNNSVSLMYFGDISSSIIDLLVVITLFYATTRSVGYGRQVYIGWMFITLAFTFYAVGDILWGILELVFHQNPFPSVADVFYLIFYPVFALGIYYLPRFSFTRSENLKIFLDMGIIVITVGLLFWTFLIVPTFSSQENSFANIVSVVYIIGDFLLFFVLLRLLYSKFDEYMGPVLLLSMGVLVMIITDSIYAFQTLQGTYVSGGLLDTGWILSFVFVGLAAFLQATNEKIDLKRFSQLIILIKKFNLVAYLPFIWVLIAFTLLVWAKDNQFIQNYYLIELTVGFIIFLVIIRQIITLNENKNLLIIAEKEIESRKNAENKIQSSLNEKNILLQEIHHRVKNNMQIISSLLNLQTRYVDDEEAVNVLKESQNRVRSMAMIHEKLYQSKDLSHIDFLDYIQSLVSNLFYSYNVTNPQIISVFKIDDIKLNMETAIPCGLIISEIVSNSLKYAFPNEMYGEILVSLKSVEDGYELIISDNGIGLADEFDIDNNKSLGLILVKSLTEQIDGEITITRNHGTEFKINFKEQKYKERIY